jgi:lysozyme family protein
MADKNISFQMLGKWEGFGVFTEDPEDPGGGTMSGITTAEARRNDWLGPMKDMPLDFALNIYSRNYWEPLCLDLVDDQRIADQILQGAVNQGTGRWAKYVQEACNKVLSASEQIVVDGQVGTETLCAINIACIGDGVLKVSRALYEIQEERYDELVLQNPKLGKFREGWHNRAVDFLVTVA